MEATQSAPSATAKMKLVDALEIRLNYRPSPPTIWRWRKKGVNGVKLKAERCGRQWMTTLEKVDEFIRLQSETEPVDPEGSGGIDAATMEQLRAAKLI